MNKKSKRTSSLPSKAEILAFIGNQPGKVGTREIARAFGLKNALRADLKRLLRDMADEGSVEKRRKKLHHPGALPSTVLADVTARDNDGDLIATPDEWDEDAHGTAPKIRIHVPRKARPGEAAGLGGGMKDTELVPVHGRFFRDRVCVTNVLLIRQPWPRSPA